MFCVSKIILITTAPLLSVILQPTYYFFVLGHDVIHLIHPRSSFSNCTMTALLSSLPVFLMFRSNSSILAPVLQIMVDPNKK